MSNLEFECTASLQADNDFQSHASLIFRQLLDLAPSDSSLSADISENAQGFRAQVAIHSINGRFLAEAEEVNAILTLDALNGRAREQISAWKSTLKAI